MRNKFIYSLIFIGIFFVLDRFVGAFLEIPKKVLIQDKKYDSYWRWKEFYELPQNSLDLIFLGSSHCYRTFDPKIFDERLELTTMNMGSSVQTPLTSYYVLKEVLNSQKPRYVVLELYWITFQMENGFFNATYNFENMRWGDNKFEFFMHAYKPDNVTSLVLSSLHYKLNFENAVQYVRGKNISWATGDQYSGKGYVSNSNVTSTEKLLKSNQFKGVSFDERNIQQVYLQYLEKIIQLCQKQKVRLVFVTSPLPPTSLAMIKDYPKIHEYFLAIAQKHDIPYIDYNVSGYMMDFGDEYFKDDDHLNATGVEKLDRNFADRLLALGIGNRAAAQ